MINRKKLRIFSCVMLMVLLAMSFAGCTNSKKQQTMDEIPSDYKGLTKYFEGQKKADSISCWYTDESDKDWLEGAAKDFESKYGVAVTPVYYDGVSFVEDINRANQEGNGPDVYILGNDQLELAALSGLAEENIYINDELWDDQYPTTAKKASTYKEKRYGYPVYFDTYCLVYDAGLLENAPASIDDILAFLDAYEDTGSTKAVFRWDVADPYINTMFLASYANLFGENGDDSSEFKINDENAVAAMEYYQSLSAYLWMNKNNISHDTIINRIKDGTLVLGLCKSDILPTLYELQNTTAVAEAATETDEPEADDGEADGSAENESQPEVTNYQVGYVPSLTAELTLTTLSTTYNAYVNPYGKDNALGNLFALYLSQGYADNQFAGNGKLPVADRMDGFDSFQKIIYAQYINSMPVPKVVVLGDYLAESGITFDAIWGGKDAREQLDALQKKMEQKIK